MPNIYEQFDAPKVETPVEEKPVEAKKRNIYEQFDAPAPVPNAPIEAGAATDYDEAYVKKIMDAGASVGKPVTREEAIRRARSAKALMAGGPQATSISQGEASSGTGAFVEGAIQGAVPFGLGPLVIPPLEAGLSYIPGLEDLDMASQARRREENPYIFTAGEVGGALTTGGSSLLMKGGSRAAEWGITRLLGKMSTTAGEEVGVRLAARNAGTTLAKETATARKLVVELAEREAYGEPITLAERKLLEAHTRLSAPTMYEKSAELLAKPFPRFRAPAVERSRALADRVIAERLVAHKVGKSLESLGADFTPSTKFLDKISAYGKTNWPRLIGPALDAPIYSAASTTRDWIQMTPEEVASTGESYAGALFSNAALSFATAVPLGFTAPMVPEAIGQLARLGQWGLDNLTERTLPFLGSRFTRATPMEIRAAVKSAGEVGRLSVGKAEKQFIKGMQTQHDTLTKYLNNIDETITALADETGVPAQLLDRTKIEKSLEAVRKNYMVKVDGKYVYKSESLIDSIYAGEMVDAGGITRLKLPPLIEDLQNDIIDLETKLFNFRKNVIGPRYVGVLGPVDVLTEQRKLGSVLMQESALPEQIGSKTNIRDLTIDRAGDLDLGRNAEGIFPVVEGRRLGEDFATKMAQSEMYGAQVKSGTRGFGELGGYAATLEYGVPKVFGATLPGGLYTAPLVKTLIDSLTAPGNVIDNYKIALMLGQATRDSMSSLSKTLTINGHKYLRPAVPLVQALYETKPNLGTTTADLERYYKEDKEFLSNLAGPDGIASLATRFAGPMDELDKTFPKLAEQTSGVTPRQVAYLQDRMTRIIGNTPNPTRRQLFEYGISSRYVRDVTTIFDDIAEKKYVPSQGIDVLTKVYPAVYSQLKNNLLTEMAIAAGEGRKIDPTQQRTIDALLGRTTGGLSKSALNQLQADMNKTNPPPAPGTGGPTTDRRLELERTGTTGAILR